MITGHEIVVKARQFIGTPYHHLGRVKGAGIDCVGLIVGIGKELGLINEDYKRYTKHPAKHILTDQLERSSLKPVDKPAIGDIIIFWISPKTRAPQHMGIKSERGIIHVHAGVGRVVEHALDVRWRRRVCGAYRYKGIK